MLRIILAHNIDKFAHRTKKKQKKRKTFFNFFTKTCATFFLDIPEVPLFEVSEVLTWGAFPKNFIDLRQTTRLQIGTKGDPDPTDQNFFLTPPLSRGYKKLHFITFLKIRAGPEWQKRNDTGRKSSNIASVFLSDLIWYVYWLSCNTDKILFMNCHQSYGSFAGLMRNCWNICVKNENFACDFFEGRVKREIWNIWFGKLNTLIPKKNTRMLGIDYFWY